MATTDATTGLPQGWEVRHSNSKNLPYYFYPETKESNWEPPTGTDQETLKKYMERYTTVPDAQARPEGAIRCAHLLVKHNKSRRPSSWKEAEITRTKEEAYEIINAYKTRIDNNETTLRELAVTESDCASARKQGDLGFFKQGDMQAEFEEAAFNLKPGELTERPIETQSGWHIIERLE